MSHDDPTREEAETRLWNALEETRIGLLGLAGPGEHLQPMTGFRDGESGEVWFFTRDETDLARQVGAEGDRPALFCLVSKDRETYASIRGALSLSHDRARIERFWNPVVAAWYPEGRDDPRLTLLRFEPHEAQLWFAARGPVRFAWEVARANLTGRRPDMGERAEIRFQ